MSDPFESLVVPDDPIAPRAEFARGLRARLVDALGASVAPLTPEAAPRDFAEVPVIRRPIRSRTMSTSAGRAATLTPYFTVHDAAAALAFYGAAFDAVEVTRMEDGDGRIGHAELRIGAARVFLADEYPGIGVVVPSGLGGTTVSMVLDVADVDGVFARAIAAGATALSDPADQPHGARHGILVDPFGHRWVLSQQIATRPTVAEGERSDDVGRDVRRAARASSGGGAGGIWAAITSNDAHRMIRFAVEVLGFTEQIVVAGDRPGEVVHSQLTWPEGGTVQVGSAHRDGNQFSERPVGGQSLYVVTADPQAVYDRCVAAGVSIIREMETPDYDPGGSGFAIRDHEGNLWSFGTYAGE